MKTINRYTLKHKSDEYKFRDQQLYCLMMNRRQYRTVENLISFCAGCGLMQDCKPWLKVDDISRDEFEAAKNENEAMEELEAL
jgi:hypothetical protein